MNNDIPSKNAISNIGIKRLLISHNLFTAGRVFFELFLSVYIWKQTRDLSLVMWFNITYLFAHVLMFHVAASFVKRGYVHFSRIMSLVGYVVVYLCIYALGEYAINYVLFIAGFIGIFNGLYWISYQVLRFDLTNNNNRGNYAGLEKGIKIFVNILMPPLGGAIIVANFFGLGYSNIFLAGSVLFLVSLFVGNVSFPVYKHHALHMWKTFLLLRKNSDVMKSMFSYAVFSFSRGGTIARVILPLLIFDIMKNELQLGFWLSFFSVVAIFNSIAFGKFVKYKFYKKTLLGGGLFYVGLVILLILFPSFWVYILFGALAKLLETLIDIPQRVISENLIHSLKNYTEHRIEYIVIREWFSIGFGRIPSFVLLLTVGVLEIVEMKLLLFLMALAVLVQVGILRSIKQGLE